MDIVNCKDCHNENCKDRGVNLRTMCWAYKERPQPQTNADRIRSMTDEQLAAWIAEHPVVAAYDNNNQQHRRWLDWLKQEA